MNEMNWFDNAIHQIVKAFGGYENTAKLLLDSVKEDASEEEK